MFFEQGNGFTTVYEKNVTYNNNSMYKQHCIDDRSLFYFLAEHKAQQRFQLSLTIMFQKIQDNYCGNDLKIQYCGLFDNKTDGEKDEKSEFCSQNLPTLRIIFDAASDDKNQPGDHMRSKGKTGLFWFVVCLSGLMVIVCGYLIKER